MSNSKYSLQKPVVLPDTFYFEVVRISHRVESWVARRLWEHTFMEWLLRQGVICWIIFPWHQIHIHGTLDTKQIERCVLNCSLSYCTILHDIQPTVIYTKSITFFINLVNLVTYIDLCCLNFTWYVVISSILSSFYKTIW